MNGIPKPNLRQSLFRAGVLLKGLDGTIELIIGAAAWLINPVVIVHIVAVLTQDEAAANSHDLAINFLRHEAHRILFVSKHFLAIYLLGHGFAKVFIVIGLMRNKLWAYPAGMAVFGVFIAYESYRSSVTHGVGLMVLTAFDLVVVILIWLEYRAQRLEAQIARQ